jgi:hypothetical protein
MKLVVFAVVLISSLSLSQTTKDPGHSSRRASVGKKYGKPSTSVPTQNTTALANELAKIEQQGAHAPASTPAPRPAASTAAAPKTQTQGKNKPMKFTGRSPQGTRNTRPR